MAGTYMTWAIGNECRMEMSQRGSMTKGQEHEEPDDPGSREQHAMSGSHKPHPPGVRVCCVPMLQILNVQIRPTHTTSIPFSDVSALSATSCP